VTTASECVTDDVPALDEAAPRRGFEPTNEEWADDYRRLYPGHVSPRNRFHLWKYATTAVNVTRDY